LAHYCVLAFFTPWFSGDLFFFISPGFEMVGFHLTDRCKSTFKFDSFFGSDFACRRMQKGKWFDRKIARNCPVLFLTNSLNLIC